MAKPSMDVSEFATISRGIDQLEIAELFKKGPFNIDIKLKDGETTASVFSAIVSRINSSEFEAEIQEMVATYENEDETEVMKLVTMFTKILYKYSDICDISNTARTELEKQICSKFDALMKGLKPPMWYSEEETELGYSPDELIMMSCILFRKADIIELNEMCNAPATGGTEFIYVNSDDDDDVDFSLAKRKERLRCRSGTIISSSSSSDGDVSSDRIVSINEAFSNTAKALSATTGGREPLPALNPYQNRYQSRFLYNQPTHVDWETVHIPLQPLDNVFVASSGEYNFVRAIIRSRQDSCEYVLHEDHYHVQITQHPTSNGRRSERVDFSTLCKHRSAFVIACARSLAELDLWLPFCARVVSFVGGGDTIQPGTVLEPPFIGNRWRYLILFDSTKLAYRGAREVYPIVRQDGRPKLHVVKGSRVAAAGLRYEWVERLLNAMMGSHYPSRFVLAPNKYDPLNVVSKHFYGEPGPMRLVSVMEIDDRLLTIKDRAGDIYEVYAGDPIFEKVAAAYGMIQSTGCNFLAPPIVFRVNLSVERARSDASEDDDQPTTTSSSTLKQERTSSADSDLRYIDESVTEGEGPSSSSTTFATKTTTSATLTTATTAPQHFARRPPTHELVVLAEMVRRERRRRQPQSHRRRSDEDSVYRPAHSPPPRLTEDEKSGFVQPIPYKQQLTKMQRVHYECSASCNDQNDSHWVEKRNEPALALPMVYYLWNRNVYERGDYSTEHRDPLLFVTYETPCGKQLRNEEELARWLTLTGSNLPLDLFTFDPKVDCVRLFTSQKPQWGTADITNGLDKKSVSAVNIYNSDAAPTDFVYMNDRKFDADLPLPAACDAADMRVCCDCPGGDCSDATRCQCQRTTRAEYARLVPAGGEPTLREPGYKNKRLPDCFQTGIFECNSSCSCAQTRRAKQLCVNRVAGNASTALLQVFRTYRCGWGVRTLSDLPKGTFVGSYAGDVLTNEKAEQLGATQGRDTYFLDLDLVDSLYLRKLTALTADDSNRDAINVPRNFREAVERILSSDSKEATIKSEVEKMTSELFRLDARQPGPETILIFLMDAYERGNVTRFFNHSCDPNVSYQNVFTENQDPRFPVIAFFTNRRVRAGEQLRWNYGYAIDSVPGKEIPCHCLSDNCTRRLL